jgi:predicted nucleic acid-binding protein
VAWCFQDEANRLSEAVLDALSTGAEAAVPSIWAFEVANALLVGERRKRITAAQVTPLLRRIAGLPISVESPTPRGAFELILPLARHHNLTEYDAAYVELCMREALPFATLDVDLRRTARDAGITLVTP